MVAKESRTSSALVLLAKIVLFAASVQMAGLFVYWNNQELQLPLVQHANNPALFPNDPYVRTLPYYISALWQTLWIAFRFLPESPLLVGLALVERWMILWAAGRLGLALSGGSRLAEIACWALFACGMTPLVGSGTIIPAYFEHTGLAVAAFLMCVSSVVETKPLRAGVWLGVCTLCNVMHAAHGAGLLLFALAFAPPLRRLQLPVTNRDTRVAWAKAGGLALLIAAPAIVLALPALQVPHIDDGTFIRLLHFYFPYHFFPSTWHPEEFRRLAFALAATLLLTLLPILEEPVRRLMMGLTLGYALYLCMSIGAEHLGRASVVNLQFARASDLWCAVAATFMVASAVRLVEKNPGKVLPYILGGATLVGSVLLWSQQANLHFVPWTVMVSVGALVVCTLLGLQPRSRARTSIAILASIGALPMVLTLQAVFRPIPPQFVPHTEITLGQWKVSEWAREHTPVSASFLVDPRWGGWRIVSRRTSYLTWKDGAALMWYPPYGLEWARRVRDLGVDPYDHANDFPLSPWLMAVAYQALDDRKAIGLSKKYGLDYWVVPLAKRTRLPVVSAFQDVKVVALR